MPKNPSPVKITSVADDYIFHKDSQRRLKAKVLEQQAKDKIIA
jgi:hypothetical protein